MILTSTVLTDPPVWQTDRRTARRSACCRALKRAITVSSVWRRR